MDDAAWQMKDDAPRVMHHTFYHAHPVVSRSEQEGKNDISGKEVRVEQGFSTSHEHNSFGEVLQVS